MIIVSNDESRNGTNKNKTIIFLMVTPSEFNQNGGLCWVSSESKNLTTLDPGSTGMNWVIPGSSPGSDSKEIVPK